MRCTYCGKKIRFWQVKMYTKHRKCHMEFYNFDEYLHTFTTEKNEGS